MSIPAPLRAECQILVTSVQGGLHCPGTDQTLFSARNPVLALFGSLVRGGFR